MLFVISVTCEPPTYEVEHAALRSTDVRDSYDLNDWIYYSCDYGYYRIGMHMIMCTASGNWTDIDMTCHRKL